ncbi:uncharacterized protein LOC141532365 [Cotesia typhae]|uniref:uncharacterized protein LOC141532365 n=1 Tax=Cotesia typhae TaxID=2053667 RepID=UPI003D690746
MQRGFVLQVSVVGNIEAIVKRRVDKLAQYKCTLQPFIVVVGPIENISQIFLYLHADYRYEVNSLLEAFFLLFKCIFALNAIYPPESAPIWQFFQRVLWGLPYDDTYNSHYISVETLIGEYKHFTP